MQNHDVEDLIIIFNECFENLYQTRLVRGGSEPIYLPAAPSRRFHEIHFAHGFFSSALHECSHWLIAGPQRRQLEDFGYWYEPDGRTAEQQSLFESVEVKPQALEWILSVAANHEFRVSVDNLSGASTDPEPFKDAVYEQVLTYLESGLPKRALIFQSALAQFYRQPIHREPWEFQRIKLR